jgi:hypothetical protein
MPLLSHLSWRIIASPVGLLCHCTATLSGMWGWEASALFSRSTFLVRYVEPLVLLAHSVQRLGCFFSLFSLSFTLPVLLPPSLFFKTGSHCVTQVGFKLVILLPQSPEC